MPSNPPSPKYSRPKILLLDMQSETGDTLKAAGYNVAVGSFGSPYKVNKHDGFEPVITNDDLPVQLSEQEIVVIDLFPNDPIAHSPEEKHTSLGENDWWASCSQGIIDPRPRSMAVNQEAFDRILSHGGVFVIFAYPRHLQKLIWGHLEYGHLVKINKIPFDNWSFLSILNSGNLETSWDTGQEIFVASEHVIAKLLSEHAQEGSFVCTLCAKYEIQGSWNTLAKNKYGLPVAGAIVANERKGLIFIFPHLNNKPHFILEFFNNVLPNLSPQLFPDSEGSHWVQRHEYELPEVVELKNQIQQIQENARIQIAEREETIEKERTEKAYLYELIRGTGSPLVSAVKKSLEILGFQSVIDADEEMEKTEDTSPKREDLRIYDDSPILLVEVKGISGFPRDAAALQVAKYLAPRMREWQRTDIQGLSIINHQRNLPALDRDNKLPFREDILTNAQEQHFGLLTTWDLFRLTRSYLKNGWKHKHIKSLFYRSGRIDPVPAHYEFIGSVEHFRSNIGVVSVRIEAAELRQGDRIAFELPVEFEEQAVESLQVNKEPVAVAEVEMLAGILTHLTKDQAKKGVRVFRLVEP